MKNETLGQVFQRYRKAERKKIEQVEKDIRISKRVIESIEADDYEKLPDEVYLKYIIKSYAQYLGLDYNKLLNLYQETKKQNIETKSKTKKPKKVRAFLTPQMIRNFIIAIIIIALLSYLGWQINKIFEPPKLVIIEPAQDIIIDQNFIQIIGETEKEATVFINDKEVFLDANGQFKVDLDLQNGVNLIKIRAVKKHSRENVIYRDILVQ